MRTCATIASALLLGTPVAADTRDVTLSVHPAYAVAYIDTRTASGGGAAFDLSVGVSDALAVKASGFLSWHAADATMTERGGVLSGWACTAGLTYTVDVVRLVPSFDLQLGAVGLAGGAAFGYSEDARAIQKPATAFAIALGFAVDYLLTRHVALGVQVKYHAPLSDIDRFPMYLYAGPRAVFTFNN